MIKYYGMLAFEENWNKQWQISDYTVNFQQAWWCQYMLVLLSMANVGYLVFVEIENL